MYSAVGLDKSETIVLRGEVPLDPELDLLSTCSAPKRKSTDKNRRQAKQRKISEYFELPIKATKRKTNSKMSGKKAKISQEAECERQLAMLKNDGIGRNELTFNEEEISINMTTVDAMETNRRTTLKTFEMPKKKIFKFRTIKSTKDGDKIDDGTTNVVELVGYSEDYSCPTEVVNSTENFKNDQTTRSFHSEVSTKGMSGDDTTKQYTQIDAIESGHSTNIYVPKCIRSTFFTPTVSQKVKNPGAHNMPKKKDIRFR